MKMLLGLALVALSLNACSSGAQKKSAGGSHDHDDDHIVTPNSGDVHTDDVISGGGETIEATPDPNQTPVPTTTTNPTPTPAPAPTPTDTTTTNCDMSDPQSMMGMSQEQLMECLKQQAGGGGGLPPGFPTP